MKTLSLSPEQVELIKRTLANACGMAQVSHQNTGRPYYKEVEEHASQALSDFCKAEYESWRNEIFGPK
jgi:hypothetical protein